MNKIILSGRLTADAELRYTPDGVPVASFTLAVNREFKKDGQPNADFINCVIWRKPAENTANMVNKGCRVIVVGKWQTRNYEAQDGKKVYVNECIVDQIEFIDFTNANGANSSDNTQSNTNTPQNNQNANTGQFNGLSDDDINDGLPF